MQNMKTFTKYKDIIYEKKRENKEMVTWNAVTWSAQFIKMKSLSTIYIYYGWKRKKM